MIKTESNSLDFILKDLKINLNALFISVTNKCNLNCMHCAPDSHSKNKHLLKKENLINLIRQFSSMGGKIVSLGGGEPFTREDILDIIEFAYSQKLGISIETNGLLLNSYILNRLEHIRKNIRFCISLDGFSSNSHDWFRRKKGAFDAVMKNMELLESSDFFYMVSTVLHKRNRDEIGQMAGHFIFKKKIRYRLVPYISRIGRGALKQVRLIALNNREVIDFLHEVYHPLFIKARQQGLEKLLTIDLPMAILPEDIDDFSTCGRGFRITGINPGGYLGICHRANNGSPLTINESIIHDNFKLADHWFGHKLFNTLRGIDENNLKGVCSNCRFGKHCLGYCRLAAYETYQDLYAPYPICQELYEEGLFPQSSMIDKTKDTSWTKKTVSSN